MSAPSGPGRLHVLTDGTSRARWSHRDLARCAFAGGADVVQLRDKRALDAESLLALAVGMTALARGAGGRLVVNDRVDLARAAQADGVHLGPLDLAPDAARRILGPAVLIGATANDLETALRLDDTAADYLGVGPVFGTASKANPAPALGLAGLARIVRAVRLPVVAIGGIDAERVASVLETGAYGVALLSAIAAAADPREATAHCRAAIDAALGVVR